MKTLAECMTAALQRSWIEKKARAGVDASAGSLGNSETGHKAGITNPKIHTLPVLTKRGVGSCTRYGSNFFSPRGTGAVVGAHLTVRGNEFDGPGLMYRLPALRLRPAVGACSRQGTSFSAAVEMNCGLGLIPAQPCVNAQTAKEMHARIPVASRHMVVVSRSAFECVSIHAAANFSLSVTGAAAQIKRGALDTGGGGIECERFTHEGAGLCEPLNVSRRKARTLDDL